MSNYSEINKVGSCTTNGYLTDNCGINSQSKYELIKPEPVKCQKSNKKYYCHYKTTGELVFTTGITDIHDNLRNKNIVDTNKSYKQSVTGKLNSQCLYDAFGNLVCDINSRY